MKASVVGGIFYATYKNEVWNFDNEATVDRCNYLASHPHMPFHPSVSICYYLTCHWYIKDFTHSG